MSENSRRSGGVLRWSAGAGALLLILVEAAALPASSAGAAPTTRYVSSSGSAADTGDCSSQSSPCATVGYALGQSATGDTISLLSIPSASEALAIQKDVTLLLPFAGTLNDDIAIDGGHTLTVQEIDNATLGGVISGSGNLTQDSVGNSLTLSKADSYSGTTTVSGGTLSISTPDAIPSASAVSLASNTELDLSADDEIASLAGSGTVSVGSTTLTVDSTGISPFTGRVATFGGQVAMSQAGSLLMTAQPSDQIAASGGSATFTAPTVSGPGTTVTVRWQSSSDGGATWNDLTDGSGVSGATTPSLTVPAAGAAGSGTEYRAVFTLGAAHAATNAASLFLWAGTPASPLPSFASPPPGLSEPAGALSLVLSYTPGGECLVHRGLVGARCGSPFTDSFRDPATGATYAVDASNAGFEGQTVSGYAVDTSKISPAAPSGYSYVVGFAVSWSPSSPARAPGVGLTVTDPSIKAGDVVYAVQPGPPASLQQVGTAAADGTVTVSFTDDPLFLVAHATPAPPVVVTPPPTTGGGGAPSALKFIRLGGPDRIGTAVAISQYDFPQSGAAKAVVVGRDDVSADDLAGSPLAQFVGGPLLLTDRAYLDNRTAGEISRVLATGGTVYLLGQTSALSSGVQDALVQAGYHVVRLGGPDRYATAVAVAGAMGDPGTVFEADGRNAGGAVSAAPAAIASHGAILLTAGPGQSDATARYLSSHSPATRYAVGAAAVAADPGAIAIAGPDDDSTAVAVAQRFFPNPSVVGIATDGVFPDALTGASTSEAGSGPTLLVPTGGPLPAGVAAYLAAHPNINTVIVYGGTAAVSDSVANASVQAVG